MGEVKWVKIATGIYKDDKVSVLDNEYILLWVYLIARAGEINDGGKVYITEAVPYTTEQLAKVFRMSKATVSKGLDALSQLQLITVDNGMIIICNWDKHQNVDGLEALREYNREAKRKSREMSRTSQGQVKDKTDECQGQVSMTSQEKEKRNKREKETKELKEFLEDEVRACAHITTPPTKNEIESYIEEKGYKTMTATQFIAYHLQKYGAIPEAWRERLDAWEENDVNNDKKKKRLSSFDAEDFFNAAIVRSYKEKT